LATNHPDLEAPKFISDVDVTEIVPDVWLVRNGRNRHLLVTPAKFETILLGPAAAAVAALRKVHSGSVGIGIEIEPRNRLACLLQPSFVEIGFIIRTARIAAQRSIGMAMQLREGRITLRAGRFRQN
jgi:hypothetical protein